MARTHVEKGQGVKKALEKHAFLAGAFNRIPCPLIICQGAGRFLSMGQSMRWIVFVVVFVALAAGTFAAAPDDEFVDIYNQILQAQNMETAGQSSGAAQRYREALSNLQQLQTEHPSWNPPVVNFRLQFLQEKIAQLAKFLPGSSAVAVNTSATPLPSPAPAAAPDQTAALRAQIDALNASNAQLQQKLKEALSVQPSVTPQELTQAQQKIDALQKENDLLKVTLDQRSTNTMAVAATNAAASDLLKKLTDELTSATNNIIDLTNTVVALQQKLADANSQLNTLQAAAQAAPKNDDVPKLTEERDRLKRELEQRTKDLADAEAHGAQLQVQAAQDLAATAAQDQSVRLSQEVDQLRARVAVLEANPVPYSAEELAILKQPTALSPAATLPASSLTNAPANPPAAVAPLAQTGPANAPAAATNVVVKHVVAHTSKELPPGAGALMADAAMAMRERDFKGAEQKYNEVLSQDEDNVYVLAHLAAAQYESGDFPECEKTVTHAVSLDPDDPKSLYMLGILRYHQERLDDAFDALSRSAQANPTNAATQNYLGVVLGEKGQRPAAETAFRKALQVDPDYADAHYNLAFVYATETPPSLELARWHYKRALDLGHPKNEPMEKLLALTK
jgi:tetratricopeptide (TPR) repeat protein